MAQLSRTQAETRGEDSSVIAHEEDEVIQPTREDRVSAGVALKSKIAATALSRTVGQLKSRERTQPALYGQDASRQVKASTQVVRRVNEVAPREHRRDSQVIVTNANETTAPKSHSSPSRMPMRAHNNANQQPSPSKQVLH